jgi:hypothetical protein
MTNKDSIDLCDITPIEYSFTDSGMSAGIIAQEISTVDMSVVDLSSSVDTITITGAVGSGSYNWNTGSTVTFTDPYEELTKRLEKVEKIIAEEKAIRDNNPAVKNAYDEYRLLLVLAKQHTNNPLTEE